MVQVKGKDLKPSIMQNSNPALYPIKAETQVGEIIAVSFRSGTIQNNSDHHNGKHIIGKY